MQSVNKNVEMQISNDCLHNFVKFVVFRDRKIDI